MTATETTLFAHLDWPDWFARMQSPEWDRHTALVFADWCGDRGEEAVGEYVRVECELERLIAEYGPRSQLAPRDPITGGCGVLVRATMPDEENLERHRAALLADNPAWSRLPCPEKIDPRKDLDDRMSYKKHRSCPVCGGNNTDDLLTFRPLTRWPYTPFPRGVGLRMEEIADEGNLGQYRCFLPTPLALSLVAGLPTVRQLRVTDREPYVYRCHEGTFYAWRERDLPLPIFLQMWGNEDGMSVGRDNTDRSTLHPTPDAALDALASGAWEWVDGFKPEGRA